MIIPLTYTKYELRTPKNLLYAKYAEIPKNMQKRTLSKLCNCITIVAKRIFTTPLLEYSTLLEYSSVLFLKKNIHKYVTTRYKYLQFQIDISNTSTTLIV